LQYSPPVPLSTSFVMTGRFPFSSLLRSWASLYFGFFPPLGNDPCHVFSQCGLKEVMALPFPIPLISYPPGFSFFFSSAWWSQVIAMTSLFVSSQLSSWFQFLSDSVLAPPLSLKSASGFHPPSPLTKEDNGRVHSFPPQRVPESPYRSFCVIYSGHPPSLCCVDADPPIVQIALCLLFFTVIVKPVACGPFSPPVLCVEPPL